jgi:Glycosyl hydrolase family 63 C-terminal domain
LDPDDTLRRRAREILDDHWDPERGYSYPHRHTYPHQWLWDSCFTAIVRANLGDRRAVSELRTAMSGQLADGFVPHMRYAGPTIARGPLGGVSSFTQPPIYAHAARVLDRHGLDPGDDVLARIDRALGYLWTVRRRDGLIAIVHTWESGADASPRWDSWTGRDWTTAPQASRRRGQRATRSLAADPVGRRLRPGAGQPWTRPAWDEFELGLVGAAVFAPSGAAGASRAFEVAPAAFNALAAHAAGEFAALTGDQLWSRRAAALAGAIDAQLWDDREGLWSDRPVVGGGPSAAVPTLYGVLGALVTPDAGKAERALGQLTAPSRFGAEFGLAYVPRGHPAYQPDLYWRGPAWMQLNYLAALAAARWDRTEEAGAIGAMSRRAARSSGFAEYWNPETGAGHGAIPLTWSTLVTVMPR